MKRRPRRSNLTAILFHCTRLIGCVLRPYAGTGQWRGRAATDDDRRSWGYLPQERGLDRDMRVIDQLTWLSRLHGLDKVTGEARARTLLEQLGLADRAD